MRKLMPFKIKTPQIIALILAAGLGLWIFTGDYQIGGQADSGKNAVTIAEREEDAETELFKVKYVPLASSDRSEVILVRGRTQANAIVTVRAETAGIVENRHVSKGQNVSMGDLVCEIETGARGAQLAQANSVLVQAEADYNSNLKLKDKGFASETRLHSLKAALDAAKSSVATAEQELKRTKIHATATGVVKDPIAEVGDMLSLGGTCITLIDNDPMLFTGQISERDIGKVKLGMTASVKLVTGENVEGNIRYIAPSSDANTRTFETEIEINNAGNILDGMTAQAQITLLPVSAYQISPSWITLADDGVIGIRIIKSDDVVDFIPVKIVAQEKNGFWISGPSEGDKIITLGQEFVVKGEKVLPELDKDVMEQVSELNILSKDKDATL